MKPILKTPYSRVDYTLDWTPWLGLSDVIVDAVWMVTGGLQDDGTDIDLTLKKATIWLKGGTLGCKDATATCHIKTAMGREDERILWFSIVSELSINSNLNGSCGAAC
jgi:hypothetical protein